MVAVVIAGNGGITTHNKKVHDKIQARLVEAEAGDKDAKLIPLTVMKNQRRNAVQSKKPMDNVESIREIEAVYMVLCENTQLVTIYTQREIKFFW